MSRFISYLSMHQARLGFLNCLVMVAGRQLDTRSALHRRYDEVIFHKIYHDDPRFQEFFHLVAPDRVKHLQRRPAIREKRRSSRTRKLELASALLPPEKEREFYYVSELWLNQSGMRSYLGGLILEESEKTIDLARDVGLIAPTHALTELGATIQAILRRRWGESIAPRPKPNPLEVYELVPVRLLYLRALLEADLLLPYLGRAILERHEPEELLREAARAYLARIERRVSFFDIAQLKDLRDLLERRLEKKPVNKSQRVPRLEFLVDLGLLERTSGGETDDEGIYRETPALERFPQAFGSLLEEPEHINAWLDRQFNQAAAILYNAPLQPLSDERLSLWYFARAYGLLGRSIGFTPGRTLAILAGLMAWLEGYRLEVTSLFETIYRSATTTWGRFLHYSGGSRLDREFLIRVDPELVTEVSRTLDVRPQIDDRLLPSR